VSRYSCALKFADDIVQRVSPLLRPNTPLDILDFWPGCGLFSSKLNESLRPRRHVLVEPNLHFSNAFLKTLSQSKPCYKLINESIYGKLGWDDFLAAHLPEQGPHNQSPGRIPKNDTLLVLADLPAANSRSDHFRPGRWWLKMLTSCLYQSGLNMYGSVRILATCPFEDVQFVLPRSVYERSRSSILAEALGLHTIEIAISGDEPEPAHQWRGWNEIQDNRKQVAERAAANGIVTPPERELPPREPVPQVAARGQKEAPYEPRPFLEMHKAIFEAIEAGDATGLKTGRNKDPETKELIKNRTLAVSRLARDNKMAHVRQKLANMRLHIDEVTRSFSRAAADPKESAESLKALNDEIISLKSAFLKELGEVHFVLTRHHDKTIDDTRMVYMSKEIKDGGLVHDDRPFEPLHIDPEELYPRGMGRGLVYFEADPNPPALKKIHDLPSAMIPDALERFYIMTSIVGTRGNMSVTELLEQVFPKWTTNDLVRAIPSLAIFAEKSIKPGCGPMPLPDGSASDPAYSYQDNIDYDLREVRLRLLTVPTLVDIALEYEKLPDKLDFMQFSRYLGGSMTSAQIDEETTNIRLR
jgi:transcription factor 1